MDTYIVADGGGTKTDFLWFGQDGTVFAAAHTGASNALFLAPEQAAENVSRGIRACLAAAPHVAPPRRVLLFIPGFAAALPLLRRREKGMEIERMDDFWNAFYGALGAPYGIVALAGTGSFVAGRRSPGPLCTIGGWGPLFGDEGSGYRLGVLCLREAARRYDDGEDGGALTELLLRHIGVKNVVDLREAVHATDFTREEVAKLSFLAVQAAQSGDAKAAGLFPTLADELAEQVVRMAARLGDRTLAVSVTGGMMKAGMWFSDAMRRALKEKAPSLRYSPPRYDPIIGGALYLLSERLGVDIGDPMLTKRLVSGAAISKPKNEAEGRSC